MKDQIELLMKLGLTKLQATDLIKYIAEEAYEAGYSAGMDDEPAIIGETLGKSGQDFFEWWEKQFNKDDSKTMKFKKTTLIRNSQYGLTGIGDDIKKMSFRDAPVGARFKYPGTNVVCVKIHAHPVYDGKGLIVEWNGNVEGYQSHFPFVDEENGITFDTIIELI